MRASLCSTLAIENLFNACRRTQSASQNKSISATGIYHTAAYSGVLGEFGRQLPLVSENAPGIEASAQWDADAAHVTCTLPDHIFQHLTDKADWKQATPETYKLSCLQWQHLKPRGRRWNLLKRDWMSLLIPAGCVISSVEAGEPRMRLVLASTIHGLLTWRATFNRHSRDITLQPHAAAAVSVELFTSFDGVHMAEVQAIAPKLDEGGRASGICIRMGKGKSVVKVAASQGFKSLNARQLRSLVQEWGLEVPKSKKKQIWRLSWPPC